MMIKRFSFAIMCPFLVTHCLFPNTAFLQNLPKLSALLHMDIRILLLFISTFLAHMLTLIIYHTILLSTQTLHEKYPNTEFFLVCIFLCLDWIQENTDQKKLRIWTLFKQWDCLFPSTLCPNLQVQIIS